MTHQPLIVVGRAAASGPSRPDGGGSRAGRAPRRRRCCPPANWTRIIVCRYSVLACPRSGVGVFVAAQHTDSSCGDRDGEDGRQRYPNPLTSKCETSTLKISETRRDYVAERTSCFEACKRNDQTFVSARAAFQTVSAIAGHRSAKGASVSSRWAISRTTASCPNGGRSARRSAARRDAVGRER
jgi:hypothetical protein